MKLEVGMYVRTKDGIIDKVIVEYNGNCNNSNCNLKHISCYKDYYEEERIIKFSHNIIDLIEPKDILIGKDGRLYQCEEIYRDYVFTYSKNKYGQTITLVDYQIESIVTKEQFNQMKYIVGE